MILSGQNLFGRKFFLNLMVLICARPRLGETPHLVINQVMGASLHVCSGGGDENIYIHAVAYIRNKPVEGFVDNQDEATFQSQQVCRLIAQNFLTSITIETNGIGKFLPAILRRELVNAGLKCAVLEHHSHRNKDMRILEAIEVPLHANKLYLNADILSTPFPGEVREWRPNQAGCRDDGLDAVSGALSASNFKLKTGFSSSKSKHWQIGSGLYMARTLGDIY